MKIAIIINANKLSGRLTQRFTGCPAYHVAWVDEEAGLSATASAARQAADFTAAQTAALQLAARVLQSVKLEAAR